MGREIIKSTRMADSTIHYEEDAQASTKRMGKGDLRSKDILSISVLSSLDFVKGRESEHLEDIRSVIQS